MAENKSNAPEAFDDELVDEASSAFPGMEDLDGRLVGIFALKRGMAKNERGEEYPFIETLTVTLDDHEGTFARADGTTTTELVGPAPEIYEFRHSTGYLVKTLERRINGKDKFDRPLSERPYVGRIHSQPSKANKKLAAFAIREPEEADRALYAKGTPGYAMLAKAAERVKELHNTVDEAQAAFE